MHGNVKDSDESSWGEHVTKTLSDIAKAEGNKFMNKIENCLNSKKEHWFSKFGFGTPKPV